MSNANPVASLPALASDEKLAEWIARFSCYRMGPTKQVLLDWLQRFAPDHLDVAHKLLDAVIIVSEREIHEGYNNALKALPGWSKVRTERSGRWYFVGAGGAGESGPAMLRMFREANGMTSREWNNYFVSVRDLPKLALTALDSVVFVDDFAGTGNQIVGYWPIMQELVASEAICYLLLTAVTEDAEDQIVGNTEFQLHSRMKLPKSANLFSPQSTLFSEEERAILDVYGKRASATMPRGFGECGLALILSHKTPNNSLPILHANKRRWVGPFPRNLIAAA